MSRAGATTSTCSRGSSSTRRPPPTRSPRPSPQTRCSTPTSAPGRRSSSRRQWAPVASSFATSSRPRPTEAPTSATSSAIAPRSRTPTPTSARCSRGSRSTATTMSSARPAQAGIEYALSRQRPDGSWLYGERPDLAWVDGYHHGYVLDALRVCADAGLDDRLPEAIHRGLEFYRRELILPDGTPEVLLPQGLPDRLPVGRPGDPDLLDRRHRGPRLHRAGAPGVRLVASRTCAAPTACSCSSGAAHWSNPLPHIRWVVAAQAARLHPPLAGGANARRRAGGAPLMRREALRGDALREERLELLGRTVDRVVLDHLLPAGRPRRRRSAGIGGEAAREPRSAPPRCRERSACR